MNSSQICLFNKEYFIYLLNKSIQKPWLENNPQNSQWLSAIWKYILQNFDNSLEPFECLNLIPIYNSNRIDLLSLSYAKNSNNLVEYFFYNSYDLPSEVLDFLKNLKFSIPQKQIGCFIFESSLPDGLKAHSKFSFYFTNLNLNTLSRCFVLLKNCLLKQNINMVEYIQKNMQTKCKKSLIECFNTRKLQVNQEFLKILKEDLPIFKIFNKDNLFCTPKDSDFYQIDPAIRSSICFPLDPSLNLIDPIPVSYLSNHLGLKNYPIQEIINQTLEYFAKKFDFDSIKIVLEWILQNKRLFPNFNIFLQKIVLNKKIFLDGHGNFCFLNQIYDPKDKFVQEFIPTGFLLHESLTQEPFYSNLKNNLLITIPEERIKEYAARLESNKLNFNRNEFIRKLEILFEFLEKSMNQDSLLKIIKEYSIFPCKNDILKLYRSDDLRPNEDYDLIGHVKPILEPSLNLKSFKEKLLKRLPIYLDDVLENLKFKVKNRIFQGLENIYSYLDQCQADLLQKKFEEKFLSKNIPFVYDGQGEFYLPGEVILESNIGDLGCYLKVLDQRNEFIRKQKSFYLEKLKIMPKLELETLLSILENIATNENSNFCDRDRNLVYTILNSINLNHLNELIENENLLSRLLIPTLCDRNKIQLEPVDKCVYLNESSEEILSESDEEKIARCKQLGLKVCDQIVNNKFLRTVKVSSFTEKVMDFQNVKIETSGQHEDITRRIKGLLEGYKDGLAIIKELIQNADDAGATEIKFCYDKRENNQWKNLSKLLTKELVDAQGPSLLVYNNSVFTENDFNNLTRLGAGTKENSKDKIGNFGLGFTSVFNATDIPFILSQSSMLILDPSMSYLKKLGVKINLNNLNSQDLNLYSDQFKPFENIFNCNIFQQGFNYNGTFFRLPFRKNSSSKICSKVYSKKEILELIDLLQKNSESLLIFTQSVRKIEFSELEEESQKPRVLFKFEKNPVEYLKKHKVYLEDIQNDEFRLQSSILKASTKVNSIETSMIIKNSVINYTRKENSDSYWLIVSSFKEIKTKLNNFNPCVGMALELDRDFRVIKSNKRNLFCFLPLPIETNLAYHVNAYFRLTQDRLGLYERSKDDKWDLVFEWNDILLEPLVNNLILMFTTIVQSGTIKFDNLFEIILPFGNEKEYFVKFEDLFYRKISSLKNLPIFPKVNCISEFCTIDESTFVDFFFDSKIIQDLAVKSLNKICTVKLKKFLVYIPKKYLEKFNSNNFIDAKMLLNYLIDFRHLIPLNDYEILLKFYIDELCIVKESQKLSEFGEFIKKKEGIPTCGGGFKLVQNLVNPNANKYFKELLDKNDDIFPSDFLLNDEKTLISLGKLGILKKLNQETVLYLANKVKKVNLTRAKEISVNLIKYLNEHQDQAKDLDQIEWIFAKSKPLDWNLPWFDGKKVIKPIDLFSDGFQELIGCVRPLIESKFSFLTKNSTEDIIKATLEQLKLLQQYYELNKINLEQIEKTFRQAYIKFQIYLTQDYHLKNLRTNFLKKNLDFNWIYCPENSEEFKFLNVEAFAIKVRYPCEPDLLELPKIYSEDYRIKHFFELIGVRDRFSAKFLIEKLKEIRENNPDTPLDQTSFERCLKIINELVLDKENLAELVQESKEKIYLPDKELIMRNIENLCFDTQKTDKFSIDFGFFVLNPILHKYKDIFQIKDFGNQVFNAISEPFGQREDLMARIRNILKHYCTETCIFKELIQNADDAKATEIKFILDIRQDNGNSKLRGPALCCWNNSIFSEEDLRGITALSVGNKQNDASKIGRFGVGFVSVYNLTDVPQIMSNFTDYVIFDPLCNYYPGIKIENPGQRIRDAKKILNKNSINIFKEILYGFEIPEFELENSTMFRFPLRLKETLISELVYSPQKVKNLIENFINSTRDIDILLFLKNVKNISFYILDNSNRVKLIHEQYIEILEDTDSNKNFRENLENQIENKKKFTNVPKEERFFKAKIVHPNLEKNFIVFEQFGFGADAADKEFKYFPYGSIAFHIEKFNIPFEYKLYNYLPLEQNSPIKCSINANLALHAENRMHLYDYNLREANLNKKLSEEESDWNLAVLEWIILPLYLKLVNYIKNNFQRYPNFIQNFLELFPKELDDPRLKPYFMPIFLKFYQNIKDLEIIPIAKKGVLQWFKPSELVFTRNFDSHVYCILEPKDLDVFHEILNQAEINICIYNDLIDLFKKIAQIDLNLISADIITNAFRRNCGHLENKEISNTFLKDVKYLKKLLEFCEHDKQNVKNLDLNNCPLCLTAKNTIKKFDRNKKLYKSNEYNIFKEKEDLFLNIELFFFTGDDDCPYVKKIKISDLELLLPFAISPKIYYNIKSCPKFDSKNKALENIWSIIIENLKELEKPLIKINQKSTKNNYLNLIKPIEKWCLVPIFYRSNISETYLAPFSMLDIILSDTYTVKNFFLYQMLVSLDLPQIKFRIFKDVDDYLEKMIVRLDANEDILNFIDSQRNKIGDKIFTPDKAEEYIKFFSSCITNSNQFHLTDHNLIPQNYIKDLVKKLKIFHRVFYYEDMVMPIEENRVFCVDLKRDMKNYLVNSPYFGQDFLEFSVNKQLILMEFKESYANFYKFLDIEIKSVEDLYLEFFNWTQTHTDGIKKILYDHMEYLRIHCVDQEKNKDLWALMKELKFIEINGNYFAPSECYMDSDRINEIAFKDRILTEKFTSPEWKKFLIDLGFKPKRDAESCLQVVKAFRKNILEEKLSLKELDELLKVFFEEIGFLIEDSQDEDLLVKIKDTKFIPNIFHFIPDNDIRKNIYDPSILDKLICLEGSSFKNNLDLCWINSQVLPDYCKKLFSSLKPAYLESSGIVTKLSDEEILENFFKLIDLLTNSNHLSKLEIKDILAKFLSHFQSILDQNKSNKEILDNLLDKNIILTYKKSDHKPVFEKPSLFVKNLKSSNQIDGFLHPLKFSYEKFWSLFEYLGARKKVSFEMCAEIIENYKETTLDKEEFENVLILANLIFFECSYEPDELKNFKGKIYLPNALRQMKDLSTLCYANDKTHENLVKNSKDIQSICLFDIKELVKSIQNVDGRSNSFSDKNILETILLENFNWKKIMENWLYLKQFKDQAPRSLSSILEEKIDLEDNCNLSKSKMDRLNSKGFQDQFLNSIKRKDLRDFLQSTFENVFIYELDQIRKVYVNKENGQMYDLDDLECMEFHSTKTERRLEIYLKRECFDQFEINDFIANEVLDFLVKNLKSNDRLDGIRQSKKELTFLFNKFF